ncbi:metallophosphoesterase [Cognataquiflexum rubidum]|uniref:metallophosphoesterase n=1 Tax=Cognataquiflexum rubidum TaxID=2922273 RepID=UPI001F140DFA|nr:metallophosphoesterase [Cognataquiflexum rubidum]MCH6234369.1 metallophosphoesterase [Cognataquiflexum rubidum]
MNQSGPIIFLSILFLFILFLSWYVFQAIRTVSMGIDLIRIQQMIKWSYWAFMLSLLTWLVFKSVQVFSTGEFASSAQTLSSVFLTLIVTQLVIVFVLLGEDIIRNIQAISVFAMNGAKGYSFPSRTVWVSVLALTVASVPLFSFVYGIKYGKYNFKVHREVLYFEDLPEAFDGFTITQISDIHSGSLKDHKAVASGVQMVLDQKSDLFVFTGDLVNHRADEIEPLIKEFSKIKAKYGQFSILGNHDYGDYSSWPSPEAKKENFEKLKGQHAKLGFDLMLDENIRIEKDGQSIILAGVENWGVGFKEKGDLQKALKGTETGDFKILLSHDPSHWDAQVKNNPNPVHLTLSGHTHGMQFGIETQLVKWSPVQYRYPNWAGLAEEAGSYLYVNRGFGFHAFAGRVGIWPEITVIELKKGKKPDSIHLASAKN